MRNGWAGRQTASALARPRQKTVAKRLWRTGKIRAQKLVRRRRCPIQADITVAVTWRFTQSMFPELVPAAEYPGLAAHSARAEKLPAFVETDF